MQFEGVDRPWWAAQDRGDALVKTVAKLSSDQGWRRLQTLARLSTYCGRPINNWDIAREMRQTGSGGVEFPFAQSVIDTAVAKIAAKQKPKPVVLTKGAQFKLRLQARKLSKFLEGQFWQPQGAYSTAWALTRQVFFDGCVFDAGCIRVRANVEQKRVDLDRVFAHEVFFDARDAAAGRPTSLYHRYRYDRYELAARFPKYARQINEAPSYTDGEESLSKADTGGVCVVEAYRLQLSEELCGRHVIAIHAPGGALSLVDEEYERDTFPYVFFTWGKAPFGSWGTPITDQIDLAQKLANKAFDRIEENTALASGGFVDIEDGAYPDGLASIESNASLKIITRSPGRTPASITMPAPFNSMVLDWAERMRSFVFELPGVNEMMAQGRKEAGIDSGVALRDMNDLQGERFLPRSQDYEQLHIDLGKQILNAVEDLEEAGVQPKSWLPSNGMIDEIEWSKIAYEAGDKYEVTIQAASALSDSLAARKQFISDMLAAGLLQPEVARRMLASADPDLEAWGNRDSAQYNWIERIISDVLDVEDDEAEIQIEGPDPLMNLPAAMLQVTEAYLEISSWPGTPENKRRALRNWILLAAQMANAATPPAPPPGAGLQPAPATPPMM